MSQGSAAVIVVFHARTHTHTHTVPSCATVARICCNFRTAERLFAYACEWASERVCGVSARWEVNNNRGKIPHVHPSQRFPHDEPGRIRIFKKRKAR